MNRQEATLGPKPVGSVELNKEHQIQRHTSHFVGSEESLEEIVPSYTNKYSAKST